MTTQTVHGPGICCARHCCGPGRIGTPCSCEPTKAAALTVPIDGPADQPEAVTAAPAPIPGTDQFDADMVRLMLSGRTYDVRQLPAASTRWATTVQGDDTSPWRATPRDRGPLPATLTADTVHGLAAAIAADVHPPTGRLDVTRAVARALMAITLTAEAAAEVDQDSG